MDQRQVKSKADFSRQSRTDNRQSNLRIGGKFSLSSVGKGRIGKQTSSNILGVGGVTTASKSQVIGGKLQSIPEEKRKKSGRLSATDILIVDFC